MVDSGARFPLLKHYLIQARKLCNSFRFIDDLNLTSDDGEYEVIYCSICVELLELHRELTDKHEATFFEFKHQ